MTMMQAFRQVCNFEAHDPPQTRRQLLWREMKPQAVLRDPRPAAPPDGGVFMCNVAGTRAQAA
jgi:hypothetical protein